jgi:hypothetical protein
VGNAAIHEGAGTAGEALTALKAARQLAVWFRRSFLSDPGFRPGPFLPPAPPVDATVELRAELATLRDRMAETATAAQKAARAAEEITSPRDGSDARRLSALVPLWAAVRRSPCAPPASEPRTARRQWPWRPRSAGRRQALGAGGGASICSMA